MSERPQEIADEAWVPAADTPGRYLRDHGSQGYDQHWICTEGHARIGTCYRHSFTCTVAAGVSRD